MKFSKVQSLGLIVFLIFLVLSFIFKSLWLTYIGLSFFLILSLYDVMKNGNETEKTGQIVVIIFIIILHLVVYFF